MSSSLRFGMSEFHPVDGPPGMSLDVNRILHERTACRLVPS
jgi:hypothetical protein